MYNNPNTGSGIELAENNIGTGNFWWLSQLVSSIAEKVTSDNPLSLVYEYFFSNEIKWHDEKWSSPPIKEGYERELKLAFIVAVGTALIGSYLFYRRYCQNNTNDKSSHIITGLKMKSKNIKKKKKIVNNNLDQVTYYQSLFKPVELIKLLGGSAGLSYLTLRHLLYEYFIARGYSCRDLYGFTPGSYYEPNINKNNLDEQGWEYLDSEECLKELTPSSFLKVTFAIFSTGMFAKLIFLNYKKTNKKNNIIEEIKEERKEHKQEEKNDVSYDLLNLKKLISKIFNNIRGIDQKNLIIIKTEKEWIEEQLKLEQKIILEIVKKYQELKYKVNQLERELISNEDLKKLFQEKITKHQESINKKIEEKAIQIEKKIEQLNKQIKLLEHKLQQSLNQDEKIKNLENQLKELNSVNNKVEQLQLKINQLEEKIQQSEEKKLDLKEILNEKIIPLETKIKDFENELKKLEKEKKNN